jgi:hypothetical protein
MEVAAVVVVGAAYLRERKMITALELPEVVAKP